MHRRHFLLTSATGLAVSARQSSNYDIFLLSGQSNMAGRTETGSVWLVN